VVTNNLAPKEKINWNRGNIAQQGKKLNTNIRKIYFTTEDEKPQRNYMG